VRPGFTGLLAVIAPSIAALATSQVPSCACGYRVGLPELQVDSQMPDPLDTGKPSLKRWEEFRAQYSAALLAHWIFRDLNVEAAEAVDNLWGRLQSSLCDYPELMQQDLEDGQDWDGYVPLHGRDPENIVWLHVDELSALNESLFPHDLQNASIESAMRSGVVVGLHSAMEAYVKQVCIDSKKGLVRVLRDHLKGKGESLSADVVEVLADFDATRHIIIHNRGCVDDTYIKRVANCQLIEGELRILSESLIDSFSHVVFDTACLLKKHDDSEEAV
jgi:hypothetical protein